LTESGKRWVCEADDKVIGFAMADLKGHNIRALSLLPDYEKMGMGQRLIKLMLDWYFKQTQKSGWLGTAINTRVKII
jgi:N-acetylglutamate synthase-like GNAT family acetyltransferase